MRCRRDFGLGREGITSRGGFGIACSTRIPLGASPASMIAAVGDALPKTITGSHRIALGDHVVDMQPTHQVAAKHQGDGE
ncbi:hypothetical protein N9D23_05035 [Rubripirellula sp.]|nr:hypothetical protein [Rubripirellula sp.]